jgi:hypothetical protein
MKRLILDKIPQGGVQSLVGVTYDGVLDLIVDDKQATPADALYVAQDRGDGTVLIEKDATAGKTLTKHTFAGWPETGEPLGVFTKPVRKVVEPVEVPIEAPVEEIKL